MAIETYQVAVDHNLVERKSYYKVAFGIEYSASAIKAHGEDNMPPPPEPKRLRVPAHPIGDYEPLGQEMPDLWQDDPIEDLGLHFRPLADALGVASGSAPAAEAAPATPTPESTAAAEPQPEEKDERSPMTRYLESLIQ